MIRRLSFAGSLLALAASSGAARAAETAPDPAALRPLLDRFCVDCHGEFYAENEFRLDADALPLGGKLDADALAALVRVHDRLKSGEMPPEEADAPDGTLRAHSVAALAGMLHEADRKRQCEEGRTRLRRMTRGEYEHAVHDLLHVDASLKYVLPGDAVAHGFDRTVDALGTSSVLVDGYLEAAEVAVEAAAVLGPKPERTTERHDYLTHERYAGLRKSESKITHVLPDALAFYASNYTPTELRSYKCEVPGRYRVRVSAYAYNHDPAQAEPVVYSAYAGWFAGPSPTKSLVGQFAAPPKPPAAPADWAPAPAEFTLSLEEGQSFKFAPYDIGHRIWSDTAARSGETALALRWIEIEGPIVDEWPPPRYRALFGNLPTVLTNAEAVAANPRTERRYEVVSEDPGRDVRRSLVALATRAFRRPLRQGELNELAELLDERLAAGEPFAEVVKLGAKAILCDPAFLTIGGESEREEASPSRTHASGLAGEGEPSPEPLGPHALASRLSFMLWGSIPDEELRLHADAGTIADPALFREQAARLLADPKHERFTADFLDQWLDLAWIDASTPDPGLAPEYDDALRPAMIEETRRTFEHMLTHDRPVREVADADWAILNARLARHYGLDPDELGLPPAGYERGDAAGGRPGERAGRVPHAGQRGEGDGERDAHQPGAAGSVRDGRDPRPADPAAAAERARRRAGRAGGGDDPRKTRRPPSRPGLRDLPPQDGPGRLRAGVAGRDRHLPRPLPRAERRRGTGLRPRGEPQDPVRRRPAGEPRGRAAGRPGLRGPQGVQGAAGRRRPPTGPQPGGEVADLRHRRGLRLRGSAGGGRDPRRRPAFRGRGARLRPPHPAVGNPVQRGVQAAVIPRSPPRGPSQRRPSLP